MDTPELSAVWGRICDLLLAKVNRQAFHTWLKPLVLKAVAGDQLSLQVPNSFFADWLEQHYQPVIEGAAREVVGPTARISYCIDPQAENHLPRKSERPGVSAQRKLSAAPDESQLNPRFTFSSFVVGSGNQLTYATCLAVAEKPATAYNPLFIYGGVGLGKTHIMQAVGRYMKEEKPSSRVYYISSEKFMNEMIYSIQHAKTMEFKRKYRGADALLIDDVQFLAGKESTQEEFFHTFNSLYDAQKQIVVTSDRPPKEIHMLEERLVSRFNGGMVTDIQAPDLETRVAILKKKAEEDGVRLADDVALLIATHIKTNIRELEGSLTRLLAVASLVSMPPSDINADFTKDVLKEQIRVPERSVRVEDIQKISADFFRLPLEAIKGKRRTNSIVFPRQVAMFVCRRMTDCSLTEIGAKFGHRDHTTVLYACDKIEQMIASDRNSKDAVDRIMTLASTPAKS